MRDFSSILNSSSKVLNIVNKSLPLIKQIDPSKIKSKMKKDNQIKKEEVKTSSNNTLSFFK